MTGGGSVEIVKVGEGAFSFPEGDSWATPQSVPTTQQQKPTKCSTWKQYSSQESKKPPITEYSNWSQRKKPVQHVMELPSDFMMPPPTKSTCGPNCFCDQPKLATTTAQTEPTSQAASASMHQHHSYHQPMIMAPCGHCCGQHFTTDPWTQPVAGGEETMNGAQSTMRPLSDIQQRKYSLPPASHHSPEQRTSYRVKRLY
ncbi:unnamed protein product [Mesocestoides corti]|uniref:Uncharacterized protein n=1 Tax=Mesocestoides corti TaxID=53468 RepID=A0A0R3UHP9_MESCO|nr:unnamed protein product [Mesocestoides corti]